MDFPITKPVIVLVGPTAIGKTEFSLSLAESYNCEIVGLDSMQVYRFMNIGTAKVTDDERKRVVHHLIDVVDPDETYDAKRYVDDALRAIAAIHKKSKIPLITGGTGLYLRSLIEGLFHGVGNFPEIRNKLRIDLAQKGSSKMHDDLFLIDRNSALKIHKNDTHRLIRALEIYYATGKNWTDHIADQAEKCRNRFVNILQIGLTCDRNQLYQRINERTLMMLRGGLKEEVEKLLSSGYSRDLKSMQSIGYRHMICHLLDSWSLEDTEKLLARDTRRYAKRQYTWFKKMQINWFQLREKENILRETDSFLQVNKI